MEVDVIYYDKLYVHEGIDIYSILTLLFVHTCRPYRRLIVLCFGTLQSHAINKSREQMGHCSQSNIVSIEFIDICEIIFINRIIL